MEEQSLVGSNYDFKIVFHYFNFHSAAEFSSEISVQFFSLKVSTKNNNNSSLQIIFYDFLGYCFVWKLLSQVGFSSSSSSNRQTGKGNAENKTSDTNKKKLSRKWAANISGRSKERIRNVIVWKWKSLFWAHLTHGHSAKVYLMESQYPSNFSFLDNLPALPAQVICQNLYNALNFIERLIEYRKEMIQNLNPLL